MSLVAKVSRVTALGEPPLYISPKTIVFIFPAYRSAFLYTSSAAVLAGLNLGGGFKSGSGKS